ncbi:MAG: LysR family transcriptional regulator [Pannonibacter phragmitetus]
MNDPFSTGTLHKRGLKLSHLRLMASLGERPQVSVAATLLGMTQPAASRLLAEVERIIGQPVHQREGRGLSLTSSGQALARRAARILQELDDAGREIEELAEGSKGEVRIGSVTAPSIEHVLPAVQRARELNPGLLIEVIVDTSDNLCKALMAGRIDFAVGRLVGISDPALVEMEVMEPEPVSLMVRHDHPLLQSGNAALEDIIRHDWVMPSPDSVLGRAVIRRLSSLGLPPPRQQLSTASFLLTLAIIRESDSIAPVAKAVADAFAQDEGTVYGVLPVELGIEVEPYGLIRRSGSTLTPAASKIAGLILEGSRAKR